MEKHADTHVHSRNAGSEDAHQDVKEAEEGSDPESYEPEYEEPDYAPADTHG